MGMCLSPSYANLFMGVFETTYVTNTLWADNITIYKIYIDDLFLYEKEESWNFMTLRSISTIMNGGFYSKVITQGINWNIWILSCPQQME